MVRALAVATRSLDLGEEYAAEAFARAAARPHGEVDDLVAWCVQVGRRAWLDDVRRQQRFDRLLPDLAVGDATQRPPWTPTPRSPATTSTTGSRCSSSPATTRSRPAPSWCSRCGSCCGLDTRRIASHLGIAEATAAARLTRAKSALARARGEFAVPGERGRRERLPVVLACVAGLLTVGQRDVVAPTDATDDPARDALTLAEALAAELPDEPEVLGLRAVCRLALARRPGRVRDGVALPLDEVDRVGLGPRAAVRRPRRRRRGQPPAGADPARAGSCWRPRSRACTPRRRARRAPTGTGWPCSTTRWSRSGPSPAVEVARVVVAGRRALRDGTASTEVETRLEALVADGPAYAARDAGLALADLAHRTGRRDEAAARYRELVEVVPEGPLREFCRRRAG